MSQVIQLKKCLMILLCFLLLGCTPDTQPETPENQLRKVTFTSFEAGFDTVFYLTLYSTDNDETLLSIFNECVSIAYGYHQLFDIYNNYNGINNIKTINDNAGIVPVKVNADVIEMLKTAKEMNQMSNGEFDVTYGSVLKVWHNYRDAAEAAGKGPVPNDEELKSAAEYVGWNHVIINEQDNTVYIDEKGVSLDVGGIAKGFTTEKLADYLASKDIETAIINFGGNNRVIGNKPDGTAWGLGIEQPGTQSAMVAVSLNAPISAVTSGDYHRYYVSEDGNTYHHIIDPSTLYPSEHFHSVTIYTKDSGYADALSTSLFTMSIEDGMKLVEQFNQTYPNTPASVVWIMDEDKAFDTSCSFKTSGYFVVYTEDLEGKIRH